MPAQTLQDAERLQKRWLIGAIGIALLLHGGVAGALGFYRLHGMEIPSDHSNPTGPFTIKRIEMSPDALKSNQADPTTKLPQPEPPKNPASFNLDPNLVEKALQAPLPKLSAPNVPEPERVIAATDLDKELPFTPSDSAPITAEVAKVEPSAATASPAAAARLAQDVISNSAAGLPHPGTTPAPSMEGAINQVPGFGDLASGFKPGNPALSNLPDPVLLRLPSDVLFDFDSAVLKPEASSLLSQAVGLITKNSAADVQIDGYSDSIGKPDYNLTLSEQRAQAVQAWLQDHVGESAYKFKSQGHGSANYIVPATGNIEAQQPNRRVEILIQALK